MEGRGGGGGTGEEAHFEDGGESVARGGHGRAAEEPEEVEAVEGVVCLGVGGEDGVPGYEVSGIVGRCVEQFARGGEGAAFGVHGDEVVGEETFGMVARR